GEKVLAPLAGSASRSPTSSGRCRTRRASACSTTPTPPWLAAILALGPHRADLGRADRRHGGGRVELQLTDERPAALPHARRGDGFRRRPLPSRRGGRNTTSTPSASGRTEDSPRPTLRGCERA